MKSSCCLPEIATKHFNKMTTAKIDYTSHLQHFWQILGNTVHPNSWIQSTLERITVAPLQSYCCSFLLGSFSYNVNARSNILRTVAKKPKAKLPSRADSQLQFSIWQPKAQKILSFPTVTDESFVVPPWAYNMMEAKLQPISKFSLDAHGPSS